MGVGSTKGSLTLKGHAVEEVLKTLRSEMMYDQLPAIVVRVSKEKRLREKIYAANTRWLELFQYRKNVVVGRAFSEIPGFQGRLTNESCKLQLACLLMSPEDSVKNIEVINYTGRSREPIFFRVDVRIIKRHDMNIAFYCTCGTWHMVEGSQENDAFSGIVPSRSPGASALAAGGGQLQLADGRQLQPGASEGVAEGVNATLEFSALPGMLSSDVDEESAGSEPPDMHIDDTFDETHFSRGVSGASALSAETLPDTGFSRGVSAASAESFSSAAVMSIAGSVAESAIGVSPMGATPSSASTSAYPSSPAGSRAAGRAATSASAASANAVRPFTPASADGDREPPQTWKQWLKEAKGFVNLEAVPCVMVVRGLRGQRDRGVVRILNASKAWLEVFEYNADEVIGKTFGEVAGFQGSMTTEISKLNLASLLVSSSDVVEKISVVNYTGRRQRALEQHMKVKIFKNSGQNVAFLCTVERCSDAEAPEPEPEDQASPSTLLLRPAPRRRIFQRGSSPMSSSGARLRVAPVEVQ
eukprot:TRINITY_DN58241_c0_g1_i2.p1 TRINITY_DN58241_c0_g1~~TRINITY_DN58241_c0_g1_i2.p1  ORF type:complete len:529 (-),score=110.08 TRINITY_DN58241_c0_g1_i2:160-1746(-)